MISSEVHHVVRLGVFPPLAQVPKTRHLFVNGTIDLALEMLETEQSHHLYLRALWLKEDQIFLRSRKQFRTGPPASLVGFQKINMVIYLELVDKIARN